MVGVVSLLLIAGVWVAWQIWQVNRDLSNAVAHAGSIQSAMERGDTSALRAELEKLRSSSASASDRTSGATWSMLKRAPILGDDAEGVEVASQVLDMLAKDGLEPLISVSGRFDELLPKNGGIDLSVIEELKTPVVEAEHAFVAADRRLSQQDSSSFVDRLDRQFARFSDQVSRGASALGAARTATDILPAMLGERETRTYLLAFQNNAELRATGGLPGAVAYLEATGGKLRMVKQATGGSLGQTRRPVLPLSGAERELYDEQLGTYFVDATMTPDVPRAAALMRAHSQRASPGIDLDGVLLVDTVAMAYLLEASGPMMVQGVELTGENLIDELLHNTYVRLEPAQQDAFFATVAKQTFDSFTEGAGNPEGLLRALARSTDERRVAMHLFDAKVQEEIAGTSLAGEFVTDPAVESPQIAVTLNDTTGSKMSYFLRVETDVSATSCVDEIQTFAAKARLRSTAPVDAGQLPVSVTGGGLYGTEPGHQLVTVRMFAPVGGEITRFKLNSEPVDLVEVVQDGRPVGMTYIDLAPGQTLDLSWQMKSGAGQVRDAELATTPTVSRADNEISIKSACR